MTESTRHDRLQRSVCGTGDASERLQRDRLGRSRIRVGTAVSVEATSTESVLEALYRHGYSYRIGCRRGGCGVCKADLVDGTVTYPTTVSFDVLSVDERTTGTCLTCRAVPDGDIVIALRDQELKRGYLAAWLSAKKPVATLPPNPPSTTTTNNRRTS